MLKRIAALIFVLVLAGQVLAGVCVCFDEKGGSHSKMSCCKKSKADAPSISKRACCDSVCGQPASDPSPRSASESSIKIPLAVRTAVEKLIFSLNRRTARAMRPPILKRSRDALLRKSKPPDLYLYNQAFLI